MSLSTGVLLRDFHFKCDICATKRSKQRTYAFSDLEVDRTVFNLNDHIVVKVAVKRLEIIISGFSSIDGQVLVIEGIAVNETSVEQNSIV